MTIIMLWLCGVEVITSDFDSIPSKGIISKTSGNPGSSPGTTLLIFLDLFGTEKSFALPLFAGFSVS